MDQCFASSDRSGSMNAAEPASPTCNGSPVEILGDVLQHLRFPISTGSNKKTGAGPTLEAQDAACCAACRQNVKCEFWVRNAHGDCWLERDAIRTQPSGQRRSGVLRYGGGSGSGGRADPLSRLSRAYGIAYAASPFGGDSSDGGLDVDPHGWCGRGCGTTCWRERFMDELWASRQRYVEVHYTRVVLCRPIARFPHLD